MKSNLSSNIRKYYIYHGLTSLEFFAPVIVIFWQSRGLSMSQIMLLQSIYAICVVVLELPTGAFADRFGKRPSLILGSFISSMAAFTYSLGQNFGHFVVAETLFAFGIAFISGADKAFIHETLSSLSREEEYKKVDGRSQGLGLVLGAASSLLGGIIGSFYLALTLAVSGISNLFAATTALLFKKPRVVLPREEKTEYLKIIRESVRIIKSDQRILWLVLFFASFNALSHNIFWFSQPYFQSLNIPVSAFGAIFAGFTLIAAFGSWSVDWVERFLGKRFFLVISVVSVLAMLLIAGFKSLWIIPLWSFSRTFSTMNQTAVSEKILRLIPSSKTATVLSFMNLLRRAVYSLSGPILGMVADTRGIQSAVLVNAVILGLILVILFWWREGSASINCQ